MSKIADQQYLRDKQYRDATRFNARATLHERFSTNPQGWLRWSFDQLLQLPDQCRILELGCGPAYLWRDNAERIPSGWEIMLSDFSPGMLDQARRNVHATRHRFTFDAIDAQAIPIANASFDAVIANHMLYHVPDRERAYSEIRRVLQPNGRLYAATNGSTHLQELHALAQHLDARTASWGGMPANTFLLDNGANELARWFDPVELRRYSDALLVTEAAPLVDFILSMADVRAFGAAERQRLLDQIAAKIASDGPIHISKDVGMFVALAGTGRS